MLHPIRPTMLCVCIFAHNTVFTLEELTVSTLFTTISAYILAKNVSVLRGNGGPSCFIRVTFFLIYPRASLGSTLRHWLDLTSKFTPQGKSLSVHGDSMVYSQVYMCNVGFVAPQLKGFQFVLHMKEGTCLNNVRNKVKIKIKINTKVWDSNYLSIYLSSN